MKRFYTFVLGLSLLLVTVVSLTPQAVYADNAQALCEGSGGTWSSGACTSSDKRTVLGTIQNITDVLIFITSAVAVLMVIVGGLRYTLSAGDQAAMTSAKNTIMYALIGLVVAIMAYAIVHFLLGALGIK